MCLLKHSPRRHLGASGPSSLGWPARTRRPHTSEGLPGGKWIDQGKRERRLEVPKSGMNMGDVATSPTETEINHANTIDRKQTNF